MATDSTVAVVALDDVTKKFGGAIAAQHASLDVHAGQVHSLVGENGAGKSTLMKILGGVQGPDEGSVLLRGEPVTFSSARQAEAAGITMIPQELDLFNELSAAENLYIGRKKPRTRLGLIDYRAMAATARSIFHDLQVEIDPRLPVGRLRAAARQLVAIARALVTDTEVLILDEPTAALTDVEAQNLLRIIRELTRRGKAIVYISHRLDEIFAISDVITVLRDGRVVETVAPADIDERRLVKLMVGRDVNHLYQRTRHPLGATVLQTHAMTRRGEFDDITVSIRSGEIVGLSGLIGAGRTEFAHALFGISKLTSGSYSFEGREKPFASPKEAQDAGIGYVPEERRSEGLIIDFSVAANITYGSLERISRLGLVDTKKERSIVAEKIREFGVKARTPNTPVSLLSGGNQQKVVLAKALLRAPRLLILDEPTRGVDVGAKAEIYALIDELAKNGTAILLISSELPEVLSMADRVVVMRLGKVVATFDHTEVTPELVGAAQAGADGSLTVEVAS